MCTSIQREDVDCTETDWISCYEWCISDPGGLCTRVWVQVRENGTNIELSQCSQVFEYRCPTMLDPPANETLNCKDIDNYQCADLSTVLQCADGLCTNITLIYKCEYKETGLLYDCSDAKIGEK
ncbi:uncharacterized protein LOC111703596 [Eurytemora carolleeae]|uniref:uncharacterized protein LOC111703596 n=1 Tax=Eurytemora carolleeae TaxID=1294199 RepID=UPI000C768E82|nr:uncharacterized protein LOC111703596 [Eurytemora carolleeae]|eukprot:XP_023331350.1 uncharacterized protein LOC111703596 [Eurytemora affinis]